MPIRAIDYRHPKLRGTVKPLTPKSKNPSKSNINDGFVFSSDVTRWYDSSIKERNKFHNAAKQKAVVKKRLEKQSA
jgi:hypothetical protein